MLTSSQRLYKILIYQQKKWLTHWGGGWGRNKAWGRETMFSQLAKQSARQQFY